MYPNDLTVKTNEDLLKVHTDDILLLKEKIRKLEILIKSSESFLASSQMELKKIKEKILERTENDELMSFLNKVFPNYKKILEKITEQKNCGNCHCYECAHYNGYDE